jgi:hypothetical protein
VSVYCGDGEPVAYYRETRRTARKQHECCACEIQILPGHRYWVIAACWDGRVQGWKRCARCQLIHEQLRPLCRANDEWPDEELNCGHTFEENYDRPPPDWMAALAFWQPGDPLPAMTLCDPRLGERWYDREIHYLPLHTQQGWIRKGAPYGWGMGAPHNNAAHRNLCTTERISQKEAAPG